VPSTGSAAAPKPTRFAGSSFERPAVFWFGMLLVVIGVGLQLPMYIMARSMHYMLAGMAVTPEMWIGMAVMTIGVAATVYSVIPVSGLRGPRTYARVRVSALDDGPIRPAHIWLLLTLSIAITIDVMKPTAFAFLASGAAAEYGLKSPASPHAHGLSIAFYPLSGIAGTALGAFIWGWFGDRVGRRGSIVVSGVIFVATSTCGTMPAYWMNLATCLCMGLGVGGLVPIAFSLMSETIPARHRGWMMVLIGGDIAGAYIITSWVASTIASPAHFGWRMLWLIGLPTGLVLIALNRFIPESPRYLLQRGRDTEAKAVLARYGAVLVEAPEEPVAEPVGAERALAFREIFRKPFLGLSAAVVLLALSIGLTQYGFQQWMPSNLQRLGFNAVSSSEILRDSAMIGLPFSIPVALLYGFWSSKKTMVLMAGITLAALAGFAIEGDDVVHHRLLLHILLVIPIWGIGLLNSVLAAYTAEVYPTVIRARSSGMSAGMVKVGGLLVLALVAFAVASPSLRLTAAAGVIPMAAAMIVIILTGPETTRKSLEQITEDEFAHALPTLQRLP
jgi:putative MFS transporter